MREVPDFLAHLRRDRRGLPVPFINRWGPESTERLTIAYDTTVRGPALFDHDQDEPVPDFWAQNMQRQRQCAAEGRCQVCGRHIPWSRRHLVISAMSVQRIDLAGRRVPVVTEPWLDPRCGEFAMRVCPGLIRRRTAEDLTLVPVSSQREAELLVSRGWVEGQLEQQSKRALPAMWIKIALTRIDLQERAS